MIRVCALPEAVRVYAVPGHVPAKEAAVEAPAAVEAHAAVEAQEYDHSDHDDEHKHDPGQLLKLAFHGKSRCE